MGQPTPQARLLDLGAVAAPGSVPVFYVASANAPPDADPDHAKGGLLNNEDVLFHDDGHILGDAAHIKTANKSVDELVASLFMTKYILAERPDLAWVVNASHTMPAPNPLQYTSLADLDYLDGTGEISAQNAYWYLRQMVSLIASLSRSETFPAIIAKLQKTFPAPAKHETPEEINNRLESIWPGFRKTAGSLAGPSTIQRTTPTACAAVSEGNETAHVVIQNDAANLLKVTIANDQFVIPDHSWKTFRVKRNQSIPSRTGPAW
jgi:hypothetical protein